ncbi:YoaH family protein, partial [Bradyrhizobium uaiense]
MATLTINGRSVTVDDGFLSLSHEEQQDAVEHIASNLPADKPKEASGLAAGIVHGGTELARGIASTAKRFTGVGDGGKQLEDPNYVPANVTNGSWNPLNWSPSQIPQKVAESLPTTAAATNPLWYPQPAIACTAPSCLFTVPAETFGPPACFRPCSTNSGSEALRSGPLRVLGTIW